MLHYKIFAMPKKVIKRTEKKMVSGIEKINAKQQKVNPTVSIITLQSKDKKNNQKTNIAKQDYKKRIQLYALYKRHPLE